MRRGIKTAVSVIVDLIIFILLPSFIASHIPPELTGMIAQVLGLSLQNVLLILAAAGIVLASLSIVKGISSKWSTVSLAASIIGSVVIFVLVLFFTGLGDPLAFGYAMRTVSTGEMGSTQILLDLRLTVFLAAVLMILSITRAVIKFRYGPRGEELKAPQKGLNPQL
jgi:hypothetical protein